jgi:hypothetical protein
MVSRFSEESLSLSWNKSSKWKSKSKLKVVSSGTQTSEQQFNSVGTQSGINTAIFNASIEGTPEKENIISRFEDKYPRIPRSTWETSWVKGNITLDGLKLTKSLESCGEGIVEAIVYQHDVSVVILFVYLKLFYLFSLVPNSQ